MLRVKVVPKAAHDGLAGWIGDELKVRVAAPPEGGRANAAVLATLAEALGLPLARIRLIGGATAPRKLIAVDALSPEELRRRLERAMAHDRKRR